MRRWFLALLLGLTTANAGLAQDNIKIEVKSDKHAYENVPLTIPLSVTMEWAKVGAADVDIITGGQPGKAIGQFTDPGITTDSIKPAKSGLVRRDLHVVLPAMPAGKTWTLNVHPRASESRTGWIIKEGEYAENKPLRFVNRPYDTSSKDARDKSYKVFHHLYDPDGKRFVTNGGFTNDNITDPKKLLYPHHRGIMYGFNKCSYGPGLKKKADTWHCTGDAHVSADKYLLFEDGPVLCRHRVLLGWYGEKNERFAEEERELTAYRIKGGILVEFASRLKTTDGPVRLDGDPQHAGFQFRAADEVKDTGKKQTYYLHPDGKGEMGKERNWDKDEKKSDKTMVDLPWYVLSFVLDGNRYSVCYLNHPGNPKETRLSERYYGRFGGYFEYNLTAKNPLVVDYRLWLQNGEMTPAQAESLRTAFASPPAATVK